MGKYILKRVSYSASDNLRPVTLTNPNTYILKRETKNFGLLGTIGDGVNKVVGMGENVVGSAAEGVGKVADSFVGKNMIGTTAGSIAGMALLPKLGMALGGPLGGLAGGLLAPTLGLVGGGLLGRGIMSAGGKALKSIGDNLKGDADTRM